MLERVDRTSSPAHSGKLRNAIDFIVPENTPVLAAANGVVTSVKDDSSIGDFSKDNRFIEIIGTQMTS
jgi:murein DD-endopeptidase MepM/ murein hydrolase activator NlpD